MKEWTSEFWIDIIDKAIVIGLTEEAIEEIGTLQTIDLQTEGDESFEEESCGEIIGSEGSITLVSPLNGIVTEINLAAVDKPQLVSEDPTGDGWLIKIEPHDSEDLLKLEDGEVTESDDFDS